MANIVSQLRLLGDLGQHNGSYCDDALKHFILSITAEP